MYGPWVRVPAGSPVKTSKRTKALQNNDLQGFLFGLYIKIHQTNAK
jgi:hypothetical protein